MGDSNEQQMCEDTSEGIKMEELDCGVVFVEDWIDAELLGQEQVIIAEQLTNIDTSGMETYFIEVADDSVGALSVLKTEETDKHKTLKRRKLRQKNEKEAETENVDVDLSWLIGFKLDGLMNNNVLDDWPNKDAKKSEIDFLCGVLWLFLWFKVI